MIRRYGAKTLAEWIILYESKTNDKVELPKGFQLYFLPERGFCQYKVDIDNKMLIVYQLCGDAKFWRDVGELICLVNKLDSISTICTRNILAYIRFWGWKIKQQFDVNNQKRFICEDTQGRKIIITHKHIDGNGDVAYWVTHYITERS